MEDFYFANARLYDKNGLILCMYTLTSDCSSVFPISGLNNIEINVDVLFIKFFNFTNKTIYEGEYDYNEFINCVKDKCKMYDKDNIIVCLSVLEIEDIIKRISIKSI